MSEDTYTRRRLLLAAAGFASAGLNSAADASAKTPVVTLPAGEKLMQDHGVLGRTLLIYEALSKRFNAGQTDPADCFFANTDILVKYIQGHHERLEELLVFPALTKARVHPKLISTLVSQHQAGREITKRIEGRGRAALKTAAGREDLAELGSKFAIMFRPHALREDTVVFPELRKLMTPKAYSEFSEKLENLDQKMMNKTDLENLVKQLNAIEKALGIDDLEKFTATLIWRQ